MPTDDEWITCPECEAEGEVDMEGEDGLPWNGSGRFVSGSGRTCPLCRGDMGFDDEIALSAARNRLAKETPDAQH